LDIGFHLLIFCKMLSSVIRPTCPNQFSLCFLINPIIFCPFGIPLTFKIRKELLYLKVQSVPRCKHFSSRFMM
jgi:hypothetical protein